VREGEPKKARLLHLLKPLGSPSHLARIIDDPVLRDCNLLQTRNLDPAVAPIINGIYSTHSSVLVLHDISVDGTTELETLSRLATGIANCHIHAVLDDRLTHALMNDASIGKLTTDRVRC